MAPANDTAELLSRYEEMEFADLETSNGHSLSGWQCENPFVKSFLRRVVRRSRNLDRVRYTYVEDDEGLCEEILALHERIDHRRPQSVYAGIGASSFLFAFAACLEKIGFSQVYVLPPLYFTLQYALRLLGIRARPISAFHAFEEDFAPRLPQSRACLLLTDPVWYVGRKMLDSVFDELRNWQARTGSVIFVDGSFQYLNWHEPINEASATLDPELTFRVLSPTKALCVHGYRFAYIILPLKWRRIFANAYANIYGSANAETLVFARESIAELSSRSIGRRLARLLGNRYETLCTNGVIESVIRPDCGYFVFVRIRAPAPSRGLLDGSYFDQPRFPGYVRLNLLSPSLPTLLGRNQSDLCGFIE